MAVHFPSSPRPDLVPPPSKFHPVPTLFHSADLASEEEWFFNMKIHNAHDPLSLQESPRSPRKPKQLDPMKHTRASRGYARVSRDQSKTTRDPVRSTFHARQKLASIPSPSPAELREQIDSQAAMSIGDSLIFHNIPERCEDTPEAEVVKFCQDYLVGQRIKHVQFGHVHKMEPRFSKDAPIAARFSLILPPSSDQPEAEKYQPLPYIPPVPRRRLPILKTKSRKKAQYNAN